MRREDLFFQCAAVSAVLTAALFLLPLAVVMPFQEIQPPDGESGGREEETECAPFDGGVLDQEITLRVLDGDTVTEMDLDTYLVGVVRAEMPASFEPEALKAQAVAARTYTLYKMHAGGNHGDVAQICTDSACCQAYLEQEQAERNWGEHAAVFEEKIRASVAETDGQVILYGGQPILAVFHASSAGMTRRAGEVWARDLPYLQAVESAEVAAGIPNYYSRAEFSVQEFRDRVLEAHPEADLSGMAETWMQDAVTDRAGTVDTVSVGGITMRGSELRGILGLRSACFEWEVEDETLVFFVTGHGHGVGLSQYGANQMALEGADHLEILTHYYTGVTVGACPRG